MKNRVYVTVGYNPDFHSPKAPELFFEVPLAVPIMDLGDDDAGKHHVHFHHVGVLNRAYFAAKCGMASALVWDPAQVIVPKLRHDLSVEGLAAWHALVASVYKAQMIAMKADVELVPGMLVKDGGITHEMLRALAPDCQVGIEAHEFFQTITEDDMPFADADCSCCCCAGCSHGNMEDGLAPIVGEAPLENPLGNLHAPDALREDGEIALDATSSLVSLIEDKCQGCSSEPQCKSLEIENLWNRAPLIQMALAEARTKGLESACRLVEQEGWRLLVWGKCDEEGELVEIHLRCPNGHEGERCLLTEYSATYNDLSLGASPVSM